MGSGFRTFTAGEVLTASNVQNYLQDQVVMTFAGSAARSSAIGTANFEEGMVSYLTDTDKVEAYNGTNWVQVGSSNQGLTLINTTSFSGVTSVSLPADTFTSTYMNYRINFNLNSCTVGMTLTARMRVAGADNTQARYQQMSTGANSGGSDVNVGQLNQTSWSLGVWTNLAQNFIVDVVRPKEVSETSVMGQFAIDNTTAFVSRNIGLKQNESIAFDSMSFIASTGNIAGSINVYGYAQ